MMVLYLVGGRTNGGAQEPHKPCDCGPNFGLIYCILFLISFVKNLVALLNNTCIYLYFCN